MMENRFCKDGIPYEVCRYCKNAVYCPVGIGEYVTLCRKKLKERCPDFEVRTELYSTDNQSHTTAV